jgi:hypothetical protein
MKMKVNSSLALVVGSLVAGCGSNTPGAAPPTPVVDQAPATSSMSREPPLDVSELLGRYPGQVLSANERDGIVHVDVAADEEAVAAELDSHPNIVVDRVGALGWPIDAAVDVCEPTPPSSGPSPIDGLVLEVLPPDGAIDAPGLDPAELAVRATNGSSVEVSFTTSVAQGLILGAEGDVVNANVFDVGAVAVPVRLAPGASEELSVLVGTASCDPVLGYQLPPGTYRVVVGVQIDQDVYYTAPTAVTVA